MRQLKKSIKRFLYGGADILMYHRVVDLSSDPFQLAVSPINFDQQIEYLSCYKKPVGLGRMMLMLQNREKLNNVVAITFDDGYFDNYEIAAPILRKYDVPATFFVVSGMIGSSMEFWWDELEGIFCTGTRLPSELSLEIDGMVKDWVFSSGYEDQCQIRSVFEEIYGVMSNLSYSDKADVLKQLRKWCGKTDVARSSHRTMSSTELRILDREELFEVSAHTVNHPILTDLSKLDQNVEINQSKTCLQEILHRDIETMSFPHGKYNSDSVAAVKAAGYRYACTSNEEKVYSDAKPLMLPRRVVPDCDQVIFKNWL